MWKYILIIIVLLVLYQYIMEPKKEGLNQPIDARDMLQSKQNIIPTVKTDPVYTVVQTSTGALTVPGDIVKPKLPIYNAPNYWQLYLQRGSNTLPGQKHPMYMRGEPNEWLIWLNTNRRGKHVAEYTGNMRWS